MSVPHSPTPPNLRIAVASFVATTLAVAGWILFAASVSHGPSSVNPYTALALALGGVVLLATLVVALRDKRYRSS
jgi:uncharacterized membrane-anchored protein